MDIYSDDMTFNTFHEKKKKEIKVLNVLNDFVKPNPYFVYYMFKDTIHIDDYGSIKETLFKFPSMTKVKLIDLTLTELVKLSSYLPLWRWCQFKSFTLLRCERRWMDYEKTTRYLCPQILSVLSSYCSFSWWNPYHRWRLSSQERHSHLSSQQEWADHEGHNERK